MEFSVHTVGWSETANIYTVVYDNATSGYACAFNSQGDVEIFMQATRGGKHVRTIIASPSSPTRTIILGRTCRGSASPSK